MKELVLVIHPKDRTTDFLSAIYEGKGWDIITSDMSQHELKKLIPKYDKIVFLGHGCPFGLFGFGKLFIDSSFVYLLKDKSCVYIWCNADAFVKKYNLKGFYTGMIISEVDEAHMFGMYPTQTQIDNSNKLFAESIRKSFIASEVLSEYNHDSDNIINFNAARIFTN